MDPNLTWQIKHTGHVPIRENEKRTEAQAPHAFFPNTIENTLFSEEVQPVVDDHFISQLKAHGLFDQFLVKQPNDHLDVNVTKFFSLSSIPQVKFFKTKDFEDNLSNLQNPTQTLDLVREQQNDEVIREVISLKNHGKPDGLPNLPIAFRKYRKLFHRLFFANEIFNRFFHDECGKMKHKRFYVPKIFWREVVFRLQNSRTAGRFGSAKTVE